MACLWVLSLPLSISVSLRLCLCLSPSDSVSFALHLCLCLSISVSLSLSVSSHIFCIFHLFFLHSSCQNILKLPASLPLPPQPPLLLLTCRSGWSPSISPPAFPLASLVIRARGTASALSSGLLSTHSLVPATPCLSALGQ